VKTILEKLAEWPGAMTIQDAAVLLGHHEQTLYKAARSGRLPTFRGIGGSVRIDPAHLAEWLRKRGA
jgi:excisionase family DNA binding protein